MKSFKNHIEINEAMYDVLLDPGQENPKDYLSVAKKYVKNAKLTKKGLLHLRTSKDLIWKTADELDQSFNQNSTPELEKQIGKKPKQAKNSSIDNYSIWIDPVFIDPTEFYQFLKKQKYVTVYSILSHAIDNPGYKVVGTEKNLIKLGSILDSEYNAFDSGSPYLSDIQDNLKKAKKAKK